MLMLWGSLIKSGARHQKYGNISFICRSYSSVALRDYQQDAIDAVLTSISKGIKRPAVVLATGGGKSVVFASLIPKIRPSPESRGHKTLVLAHKEELVRQAADWVGRINPTHSVGIDMRRISPRETDDVIVASVPTIIRQTRLSRYRPEEFKTIIIDECHHAPAQSWRKILEYFGATAPDSHIYVVGFTATMERSDSKSLGEIFGDIVYERDLLDMIRNKELADMVFSTVDTDIDFEKVTVKEGDYEIRSLSGYVNNSEVNFKIVLTYLNMLEKFNFKSTLVFCVDINHCKTLCGLFQREGINAQYVTGETVKHERARIVSDFRNGKIQVLCNVQVFTEGTDIPNIDSLFLARPTRSRALLIQMVGRGLRLTQNKTHCHVIDIAGTRGTGLKSVPSLFGLPLDCKINGKMVDDLISDKEKFDEERKAKEAETIELELSRRREEFEMHKKLAELKSEKDDFDAHVHTFNSYLELQAQDASFFESQKTVNEAFIKSRFHWIRLDYDTWALNLNTSSFFLIKRQYNNNSVSFSLTLNRFTSYEQKIASNYKCGKVQVVSCMASDSNLNAVIVKAETMNPLVLKAYLRSQKNSNKITDKQLGLLTKKLKSRAKTMYNWNEELEFQLERSLSSFSKLRASNLIFAVTYSSSCLWVKWELKNILGLDKKSAAKYKTLEQNRAR
ncbi:Piso0_005052 [Millerozyma farinosa CBS 7064]|uniref:Piso0_005052 protein n=1 Tax=Pichia sorbitophila (strain ATCC MYA-4447 / BCRC 22081 / CBS 7064 / NBRC 10061 / NRRL Y-12695) TaxID=559304 RepID=G8Y438_PICSO|nr:Piso0_005052 [Millerozyma farinosa CBS 7064]